MKPVDLMKKLTLQTVKKFIQQSFVLMLIPVAQGQPTPLEKGKIDTVPEASGIIGNIATGLSVILFALAAIFIIISGIFYLTAAGNQEQLKKAKDTLIYAIVGIVLGLIAFGVADLTKNFLTG